MRIIKYFFVGGTAAIIDVGLFSILTVIFHLPWLPVSIFSFVLATLGNYFLSVQFVFKNGSKFGKKHQEIIGVFVVSILALLINQLVLYIFIEYLYANLVISKVIATGTVFLWNYYGRSRLIFK